jgi:hypothetical protein
MMQRRNYFVKDEYEVPWNDEPLPTFKQAWDFRGAIAKDLFPRTLKIFSVPRETVMAKSTPLKPHIKENYGKELDF